MRNVFCNSSLGLGVRARFEYGDQFFDTAAPVALNHFVDSHADLLVSNSLPPKRELMMRSVRTSHVTATKV
jgi:hypothetical protein